MLWFTSDLHIGHKNILKFCPESRLFEDIEQMNSEIIRRWNSKVSSCDTVYILGDVAMNPKQAIKVLPYLKGRKVLVTGNHDNKSLKDDDFTQYFDQIYDTYHEIIEQDIRVIMCHYPIYEWNQMHRGAFHLYGHVHGNEMSGMRGRSMDVGMDTNDCYPYSWEEIKTLLLKKDIIQHS